MTNYDVAVVGTGEDPGEQTVEGFSMGDRHAAAYAAEDRCRLVACADLVRENAAAFADRWDLGDDAVFEDVATMAETVEPDVVSVCVPPSAHAEVVVALAETDAVAAVHCEKPMADTWGDARRMAAVCAERGVQLTFNHQRRFSEVFRRAADLVEAGEIGDLRRVEYTWGDLFDIGSHAIDLCGMVAGDPDPAWVIGQVDYRTEDVRFGTHNENQAYVQWRYENGVYGGASTGHGSDVSEFAFHFRGTEGEVGLTHESPHVHHRRDGEGWTTVDTGDDFHAPADGDESGFIARAVTDLVDGLDGGDPPELRAENALKATEVLFAAYESSRRHGRVDCPLTVEDNPLEAMVADGTLTPAPRDD